MKVYIVMKGEYHEGGNVESVWADRDKAMRRAYAIALDNAKCCGDKEPSGFGPDSWISECDTVEVIEEEVL